MKIKSIFYSVDQLRSLREIIKKSHPADMQQWEGILPVLQDAIIYKEQRNFLGVLVKWEEVKAGIDGYTQEAIYSLEVIQGANTQVISGQKIGPFLCGLSVSCDSWASDLKKQLDQIKGKRKKKALIWQRMDDTSLIKPVQIA